MTQPDPFLVEPELWFGVLCEGVGLDERKRIELQRVFNRWYTTSPPGWDEAPFAHLKAMLAVGFSHGLGEFEASIELKDIDDNVLWAKPEPWTFRVGPGDASSAVYAELVEYVFRETGSYRFVVTVSPPGTEHLVRFEIADPVAGHQGPQTDPEPTP